MPHTSLGLTRNHLRRQVLTLLLSLALGSVAAFAQITPSQDSYTNSATPTTNYGSKTLLDVDGATQITYIQFNLASIPAGTSISQATLKLYVNSVSTAGSVDVDYINASWSEATIDSSNAPPLGGSIASSVPVVTADKNQYLLINVTSALQAWLNGSETNNGIALVANGSTNLTFDSKENTTTSHPPELDVVFAGGSGTITGVTTASGGGLQGGGTSGTLNLSLTNSCAANQVLRWNGTTWACTNLTGSGTITGVTAGLDLTGGGTTGSVTLSLDTTKVPQLNTANTFTAPVTVSGTGNGTITGTTNSQYYGYSAITGNATFTGAGSTIGVQGYSQSTAGWGVYGIGGAAGVYGGSTANGVFGNSTTGNGVYGQTASSVGGTGVMGQAQGSIGQGVWGESFGTGYSGGVGPDGVHGVAHSNRGSGVAGVNLAQDGTGVYGSDTNGYGFVTDSHVQQGRAMGGWVKAMAYINGVTGGVERCFNSQLSGSQATALPCGITVTLDAIGNNGNENVYTVDFGFEVDDRFLQLSFLSTLGSDGSGSYQSYCVDTDSNCVFRPSSTTQVDVVQYSSSTWQDMGQVSFYIFVY